MKFKVGDTVLIKRKLTQKERVKFVIWYRKMDGMVGEKHSIIYCRYDNSYRLSNHWIFPGYVLEKSKPSKWLRIWK